MKVLAIFISESGEKRTVILKDGPDQTMLQQLQRLVEGTISGLQLDPGLFMYVNDEGLFTHTVNPFATFLVNRMGIYQPIYGPVVLVGDADKNGRDTSLSDAVYDKVSRIYFEFLTKV